MPRFHSKPLSASPPFPAGFVAQNGAFCTPTCCVKFFEFVVEFAPVQRSTSFRNMADAAARVGAVGDGGTDDEGAGIRPGASAEGTVPSAVRGQAWAQAVWPDTADMPWVAADGAGALDLELPPWTASVDPVPCDCINTYLKPHVGGFLEPHWSVRAWILAVWCWRYLALSVQVALSRRAIRGRTEARDLLPSRASRRTAGAAESCAEPAEKPAHGTSIIEPALRPQTASRVSAPPPAVLEAEEAEESEQADRGAEARESRRGEPARGRPGAGGAEDRRLPGTRVGAGAGDFGVSHRVWTDALQRGGVWTEVAACHTQIVRFVFQVSLHASPCRFRCVRACGAGMRVLARAGMSVWVREWRSRGDEVGQGSRRVC